MDYQKIKVASDGAVTTVTLSDPATMNAAGVDTASELQHAFRDATKPGAATRCIVLTGEGRGFCSGANLSGGGGGAAGGGGGEAAAAALMSASCVCAWFSCARAASSCCL